MGKVSQYEQARRDGMAYALKIAEEGGVEALREEMRLRNYTKAPIGMEKKYLNEFADNCKHAIVSTVKIAALMALRDEYEFGSKRLIRFLDRFESNCESIMGGWAEWMDFVDTLKAETGLDLTVIRMDQDISITERVVAGYDKR